MPDLHIVCDRFRCLVKPVTPKGMRWMSHNHTSVGDSNMVVIQADVLDEYKADLKKAGIEWEEK